MSLLTAAQLDALQELLNIGVGRSAAMLNQMLGVHVSLQVPLVKLLSQETVQQEFEQVFGARNVATVRLSFNGPFDGVAHLLFPPSSAAKLVASLISEDTEPLDDFDAIKAGALSEVGNVVLNGIMGEISNLLHQQLRYSIPTYTEESVHCLLVPDVFDTHRTILLAQAQFVIEQLLVVGDILIIFKIGSFNRLLIAIDQILEVDCEQPSHA